MDFLSLTLPTLMQNVALDEAMLLDCEAGTGREVLRIWELEKPAVVLGAGAIFAEDVNRPACAADAVPVLRRSTGGGTVLLGQGCLLYSLVLSYRHAPPLTTIGGSYEYILDRLCAFLGVPDLQREGTSDLAIGGRKVSGNAQQRKRTYLLHHGSLLYNFDARAVDNYLHLPSRQPEYRNQRPHGEFLANLPLERDVLIARLRAAFGADSETTAWPREWVHDLVQTKYGLPEWTMRR
jgi:lipoate-protein ligase A